jgi:hypothetical protein
MINPTPKVDAAICIQCKRPEGYSTDGSTCICFGENPTKPPVDAATDDLPRKQPSGRTYYDSTEDMRRDQRIAELEAAIQGAMCKIGVPQPGYPANIANAYDILKATDPGAAPSATGEPKEE